ncbi:MAG: glycosyltransferase family 2 protein [Neisseriales bacterium]|nr:MAG: glycosyltransferase family 2 protein [Neisseriales bacterium]
MKNKFNVSVIIPMYNSENTICSTINSVYMQTYTDNLEIIIINDGSTDKSLELVENLKKQYIKIKNRELKIFSKCNGGVSSARNMGIKKSNGDIIALLDSDDEWFPEKLEKQINQMILKTDIKFLGCNRNNNKYVLFGKGSSYLFSLTLKQVLFKPWPTTPSIIFKKEIIEKIGLYDESMKGAEDFDFNIRVAKNYAIYSLNENLVSVGNGKADYGESGLSANMKTMYDGEVRILKKLFQDKSLNFIEYLAFYFWFTAKYLRRLIIVFYRKNKDK